MANLHQVIVRNTPEKGLDVVASTLEKSQIFDIFQYLPREIPSEFNNVYLSKYQFSPGKITLLFTFDDGIDQFGRKTIKTHTFVVDESFYNEKTATYFISPLINKIMILDENRLLDESDFENIDPYPVSSKFIELVYSKKYLHVSSQEKIDEYELIQMFSAIDRAIPPQLTASFSFQTMVSPAQKNILKDRSLIFSSKQLPSSYLLEQLKFFQSESPTIQAICNALPDLSILRRLQKQLFLGIPERRMSFKIHWRFGIKTFSHIRRSIEQGLHGFNVNDEVRIVHGPFTGFKALITAIDQDLEKLTVEPISKKETVPLILEINDVEFVSSDEEDDDN